ncbi:MAG: zinc ribbon domain-containing protein [Thermoleophilia bacterium]|nr:zinc ribbon domain-containing protein [Thermoleophilia bacterium]
MFCEKCGQVLEEGKAFCKNCGAPAPKLDGTGGELGAAQAAALAATQVRPPTPAPAAPVGPPAGAPPPTPGAAPPPPPAAPGYGAGWQPPQGPSAQKGRGGLIWGIVAAAIIVLAGIGVGVYFGFFRDGDEAVRTSTTQVSSTSTTGGATDTTSGPATSIGGQTDTTVAGSSTTQTIPGLSTTTSGSTTSGSDTTGPPETSREEYLAAAENLVYELEYDDGRIPELATEINNTAPKVPTWVRDELSTMLGSLDMLNVELAVLDVPAAFEDSHYWLGEAVTHMGNRVYATMQGVETMWATGKVSSANPYFDEGRVERDAYREAMDKYYEFLPVD